MRALVTGCAGFIGSHLTESLLADGIDVLGVDCFNDNYARQDKLQNLRRITDWSDFEFAPIDLARGDLETLVADCDLAYHLAAEPGVRTSWGARFEAYVRNNVIATQHLLEAARGKQLQRFVYASSSSIYGQAEQLPTVEELAPRPLSPYGVTKLGGEHLCDLHHLNHGTPTVVLRYFSVFGPRQRPDMAFTTFCRAILRDDAVKVFGDGRQTRDFTFVSDVVRATRSAAVAPNACGRAYNIGGGSQVSLVEALATLQELADRRAEVVHLSSEPGDVRDTAADIHRARAELGYEPTTELREGLAAQLEWIEESARVTSSR
jgi:nucleoside-diphosphate-sugar epimerase